MCVPQLFKQVLRSQLYCLTFLVSGSFRALCFLGLKFIGFGSSGS